MAGPKHRSDRRRRQPPPDETGREAGWWKSITASGGVLRAQLTDGSWIEGTLDHHDDEIMALRPAAGEPIQVRKRDIRYIVET